MPVIRSRTLAGRTRKTDPEEEEIHYSVRGKDLEVRIRTGGEHGATLTETCPLERLQRAAARK